MQQNVTNMRNDNFTGAEISEFGVGKDTVGFGGFDGYIYPGDGSKVYAYTKPMNFWTGKSDIVYAPITAQNKELLAGTMVHETGHAFSQKLGLIDVKLESSSGTINRAINTSDHFAIAKLEHIYAKKNLISMTRRLGNNFYTNPDDIIENYYSLNVFYRNMIDNTYNKLFPVFNRFMFYSK